MVQTSHALLLKDYMGSNGGVVLFKNKEGAWSWNITHAWQAKCLLDLSDEIVHRWWAIQHSGPAAQRKKDTESCDGHYICTNVLFSFHCSLNSEMEVQGERIPAPNALDNLASNSRKLLIVSQNHCKSCLLHLESISGYNLILWPVNFVTLFCGEHTVSNLCLME